MFEQFTEKSIEALKLAEEEARQMKHGSNLALNIFYWD